MAAYLWGAVPTTYLVGRYLNGIDIRDFGSGNVGAANFMAHAGKLTGFLLGVFDCLAKGALPVVLAKQLDQSLAVQVAAGLAAIAGHNWSPYIRFTGGRGVATTVGVLFGFQMWQELVVVVIVLGLIGRLIFRETGFWTLASIVVLPLLAYYFSPEPEIVAMTVVVGLLLILKRLTANWEPLPAEYPALRVMGYRALWDRDVPKRSEWTRRRPASKKERSSRYFGDELLR